MVGPLAALSLLSSASIPHAVGSHVPVRRAAFLHCCNPGVADVGTISDDDAAPNDDSADLDMADEDYLHAFEGHRGAH